MHYLICKFVLERGKQGGEKGEREGEKKGRGKGWEKGEGRGGRGEREGERKRRGGRRLCNKRTHLQCGRCPYIQNEGDTVLGVIHSIDCRKGTEGIH